MSIAERLTYRTAVESDLPFLVGTIVEDSVIDTGDSVAEALSPPYRDALAAIDGDPFQEMVVVELDGAPVGCFQLTFIPGLMRRGMWRGLIESVHVLAAHQGGGIGTAMMLWAIARCRERGCGMVQLTSNKKRTDAHRFYERLGFNRSHEGFKLYL